MYAKQFGAICLLVGLSCPLKAQLIDSFVVINKGNKLAKIKDTTQQEITCADADLLMSQGSGLEAAILYSELIVQYHFLSDTAKLDRACAGLYRTQLLARIDSQYTDKLKLCRAETINALSANSDWEPMFISQPVFKPNEQWINTAKPGVIYKVTVQFDIDEFGNPSNFDFNADDKFLLRYPAIEGLKNASYLPAVKNGKAVKKSKNLVEVVFCLDRGTTCANNK